MKMQVIAFTGLTLLVVVGFVQSTRLSADDNNDQRGIRKVVLEGAKGTLTLREYIPRGYEIRVTFNQDNVSESAIKLLSPAPQLFVQRDTDRLNPHATSLHPSVINIEAEDQTDFDTKALWSKLIGRKVTLEVNEDGLSAKLKTDLELSVQHRSRFRVSGAFLGYGKAVGESEPNVLKLLAGDNHKLVEIPENAIASFDFHGALSRDIDQALRLLRAKYGISKRELIVVRVNYEGPPEPEVPNSTIVFEHDVTQWKANLTAKLNKRETEVTVTGWAQIKNDTPYDWVNANVTLKKGSVTHLLKGVTLASEQTNRFPIWFLDRTGAKPVRAVTLTAERQLTITAPDDDKVDPAQDLLCVDTLSLKNAGDYPLPAGSLVAADHENIRLATTQVGEILPDNGKKRTAIALTTETGVVASYTRKEESVPVQVVGINGYRIEYYEGRVSSFSFKSNDGKTGTARLVGSDISLRLEDDKSLREINITLIAKKPASGLKTLEPIKKRDSENVLLIRERPASTVPENLADLSAKQLTTLRDAYIFSTPLRGALDGVIREKEKVDALEDEIEALEDQLEVLDDRRETYVSQVQSGYHAPILRRLATQIQQKEQEIAAQRNELAIASFERDHFISTLKVAESAVAAAKQIQDLGGYTETSEKKVVTVLFGGGYPANQVRNSQLEVLAELDTLENVSLRRCSNIRDEGLAHLVKSAGTIKSLVLDGTLASDEGIPHLSKMSHLTVLGLRDTRVTDEGLKQLNGLHENLKFLDLRDTRVTACGIYKLQKALPDCMIYSDVSGEATCLPERRWVFALTELSQEKTHECDTKNLGLDDVIDLMKEADALGYNGLVMQDFGFGFSLSDQQTADFVDNLVRLKDEADKLEMELIPTVVGGTGSILISDRDVNLAEGVPVKNMTYKVNGDRAEAVSQEHVEAGGFECTDMEQLKKKWKLHSNSEVGSPRLSRQQHNGGDQSLKAIHSGNVHWGIRQDLRGLKPWHQYRFTFSVKTDDFSVVGNDEDGIFFNVWVNPFKDLENSKNLTRFQLKLLDKDGEFNVRPTQDWKQYEVVINTFDYTTARIQFSVGGGKTGTVWIDDFSVTEIGGYDLIRRSGCPVKITSADGQTEYIEGQDFEAWSDPDVDRGPHAAPPIIVKKCSRIEDEQELKVSYFHAYRTDGTHIACCLRHPDLFRIYARQHRLVGTLLRPKIWLLNHDEIRVAGHCRLCRKDEHESVGQILAENVEKCIAIVRDKDPDAEIRVWSDMFDPHHNAVDAEHKDSLFPLVRDTWHESWNGLSSRVRIVNWNGKAESIRFFHKRGHHQLIAGFYDEECWVDQTKQWVKVARGLKTVDGVMYSTYERDYSHLEDFILLIKDNW